MSIILTCCQLFDAVDCGGAGGSAGVYAITAYMTFNGIQIIVEIDLLITVR